MKTVYEDKKHCCGCGACRSVCSAGAVAMRPDEEGFLYPVIDESKCVNCRRCVQLCPFQRDGHLKQQAEPEFFAAKHTSEEVLRKSSSGGAFTALSDLILQRGGAVYGADFDEAFRVRHARAENGPQRDRMRISKYAQSDLTGVCELIAEDLRSGKQVLFTGTPCQNAGVKSYIGSLRENSGRVPENLYLCDLICHSVPSPLIWSEFISLLETEYGGPIEEIQFRTKELPWSRTNSKSTFTFRLKGSGETHIDNRFYGLFFRRMTMMRPSCEACPFCDVHRVGDVTIADYWGIETHAPDWYDPLGVSLILTGTEKGRGLVHRCAERGTLVCVKRPKEEELAEQPRLKGPVTYPKDREEFWNRFRAEGLAAVLKETE